MTKKQYQKYIQSDEWKERRDKFKKEWGNKCAFCGSKDDLHIHHLNYISIGNETINDVVCLCKGCHLDTHKKRLKIWKFTREEREHFNHIKDIVCDENISYLFLGTYEVKA